MSILVVLPSFNESENIVAITHAVLDFRPDVHVCVVDDSSPDGTADLLQSAIRDGRLPDARTQLIVREGKGGRGSAVRAGFSWGLESGIPFEAYVEMDCDFSHDPRAISEGLRHLSGGNDVVIGARYPHGTVLNWPISRRIFSFSANLLARTLISWRVADFTNGFRFYSPGAIRVLMSHEQQHRGYIYLSESLAHLLRAGLAITSFPIVFKNRERGQSNTSSSEIISALRGILSIAWHHRTSRT